MPAVTATAPGKIILFGEHAVVYGQPAIAVPIPEVRARAIVNADIRAAPGSVRIQAPDIGLEGQLSDLPENHPLAKAVRITIDAVGVARIPSFSLRVTSTIPVAAGLGSGAAVSVATIRAVSAFLGRPLPDEQVSALAFEVDKLHHGTPSGIDNTVITYARPVYYVRGQPLETFRPGQPFTIVIGDTGLASPTAVAVGDVRRAWQQDRSTYDSLFQAIGRVVEEARREIERGRFERLGWLMDENHRLLCQIGVSSPGLDRLVAAAHQAGAAGAKLSGGGRGGNMIALAGTGSSASQESAQSIGQALLAAGAKRTLVAEIR